MPATAEEIPPPISMLLSRLGAAATVLLIIATGCDPTVDSFQENEFHYSLFGTLNASADSQFVRVEPLRDGLPIRAPESLNANVTLTNRSTNRTVSLRDSLFHYLDQATAHNFYTTAPIDSGTTYRLRVQGPNGAESRVDVTMPKSSPDLSVLTPIAEIDRSRCSGRYTSVAIQGARRVVSVRAIYVLDTVTSFGHLSDTVHTESGTIEARIDYLNDLCRIPDLGRPERIEILVAAGSADWPEFLRLDPETELLPGVASNVEGGVGYVGGVVTDTITVYSSPAN